MLVVFRGGGAFLDLMAHDFQLGHEEDGEEQGEHPEGGLYPGGADVGGGDMGGEKVLDDPGLAA